MTIAEKAPDYVCTFAGSGLLSAYAWTGTGDIRPGTNQWLKDADTGGEEYTANISVANGVAYNSNQGNNYALYFLDIGVPVKKLCIDLKNVGNDVADGIEVILRASTNLVVGSGYSHVQMMTDAGLQKKMLIGNRASVSAASLNVSTDWNTLYQTLTITDTGTVITAQLGANILSWENTEIGGTFIGIGGWDFTAANVCFWDNLRIWV